MWIHLALLLGLSAPQDVPGIEREAPPLLPSEFLFSLDRKVARGEEIGLWYRGPEGRMSRVWDGEPYDSLWLFDRTVLVVERWNGRVVKLSEEFREVRSIGGLTTPVDVEVHPRGFWVLVEQRPGRVVAIEPESGRRLWERGGFDGPFDAAVWKEERLLVADSGNDRIVALDGSGNVLRTWGGIDFPNTVEPTQDGGFLVTNWTGGEVRRFHPDGSLNWRTRLDGTLQSAEERLDGRITVSDGYAGRLFYLSAEGLLERTERFSTGGRAQGCVDCETILRP